MVLPGFLAARFSLFTMHRSHQLPVLGFSFAVRLFRSILSVATKLRNTCTLLFKTEANKLALMSDFWPSWNVFCSWGSLLFIARTRSRNSKNYISFQQMSSIISCWRPSVFHRQAELQRKTPYFLLQPFYISRRMLTITCESFLTVRTRRMK